MCFYLFSGFVCSCFLLCPIQPTKNPIKEVVAVCYKKSNIFYQLLSGCASLLPERELWLHCCAVPNIDYSTMNGNKCQSVKAFSILYIFKRGASLQCAHMFVCVFLDKSTQRFRMCKFKLAGQICAQIQACTAQATSFFRKVPLPAVNSIYVSLPIHK